MIILYALLVPFLQYNFITYILESDIIMAIVN